MATKADTAWAEHALPALHEAGYRRGGARTAVVEALARHGARSPRSTSTRSCAVASRPVGRASVYRALEQLEQLGLVQRLEVTRGTAGYERVEPGGEHHHHAICRHCGRMVPFEDSLAGAGDRQALRGDELRGHRPRRGPARALRALQRLSRPARIRVQRKNAQRVSDAVQIFLLSLLAMFNPTLLAAVTLMLLLPSPKRLMLGYLLGAYTASISAGLAIVFALNDSSVTSTSKSTLSPLEDVVVGSLLLLVALVLATDRDQPLRERRARRREKKKERKGGEEKEPLPMRLLGRGSPRVAFVVGLLLSFPGVSYLTGLNHIHKLDRRRRRRR